MQQGVVKLISYCALLIFIPLLSGCSSSAMPAVTGEKDSPGLILAEGHTLEQSFVAREDGFEAIELYFTPIEEGSGSIRLGLRADTDAKDDLASAMLRIGDVSDPAFYRLALDNPINRSRGSNYYLDLAVEGPGKVEVGTTAGETYLDGGLTSSESPTDLQLIMNLVFDSTDLWLGRGRELMLWVPLLAVAVLVLFLPGWALLDVSWPGLKALPWPSVFGLSAGIAVAVYPLTFLWTHVAGLHLGVLYAWIPVAFGLAFVIWRVFKALRGRKTPLALGSLKSENLWPDFTFIVLVALIFFVRLWVIRDLDSPMWGDSFQHTMIAQLLIDNNGLFQSWEPYSQLTTFTYHFGFHSLIAAFHWISKVDVMQSVLWMGQILGSLAVVSLYPLAYKMTRSRWAGVAAVAVAGLLSSMPMAYVNWGRYTQLTGQLILPVMVYLAWELYESQNKSETRRLLLLTALAVAGLALAHYRVLVFGLLFLLAAFLLSLKRWSTNLSRTLLLGLMAGVLFLPWFVRVFSGRVMDILGAQLSTRPSSLSNFERQYNALGDLLTYLPSYLWLLLALAIGVILIRGNRLGRSVLLWWGLLLLAVNPNWLGLPGSGALSNFALLIAVYIPASLLIGSLVADLNHWLPSNRFRNAILGITIIGIGLYGSSLRLDDVDVLAHSLQANPDLRAAAWMRENTDPDGKVYVNGFYAFGDTLLVGSDGGWWLPLTALRTTNVPPINYAFEQGPEPAYAAEINHLTRFVQERGINNPESRSKLLEEGFSYVYIGQQQGSVNSPSGQRLDWMEILADPNFRLLYHQDRVWIFEFK